ncbi:amino acid ABC transporter substrate-binding protein (PAAT family) [Arthrobacter sp. SLBN-112]|jgi:glutamate transport system substrate-binding protein|uniref:glutamate ABC transporter substrate-binding protein n=1 Tax=Arthrobacter sp. SLBN-112 TaxID=2768452 RepID=UPI0011544A80|nr:glutamate ABC transporter substrate-binding protein [Arthrobacter sp. SLBN-112]TQJ39137.1 amino acid ABC transporter substrate-binding protein (PAAT family) [Arthrobacter sp. SLBN-112]
MQTIRSVTAPAVFLLALALVALFGSTSMVSPGLEPQPVQAPQLVPGSTPAAIAQRGVLRVGVKFDHPGLSMKNLQGTPEGFEVDMVEYIAAKMGLPKGSIAWTEVTSANREQLLNQGKVDMVVATLTITDKRKQIIDFAGPYLDITQDLIVPKGNPEGIKSPVDPAGIQVCSTLGGAVSQATRKIYPDVKLIEFDNSAKCIDAIKTGAVDAYATQSAIGAGYVSKDKEYLEMLGNPYAPEKWGIGLKKGDPTMCSFVNEQLTSFESDGSYAEAWNKSIGQYSKEPAALPELVTCQ